MLEEEIQRLSELIKRLKLDGEHAKVLALIILSPSTPEEISNRLKIERNRTYAILNVLKRKKVVQESFRLYLPSFLQIRYMIKARREEIREVSAALDELESIMRENTSNPK